MSDDTIAKCERPGYSPNPATLIALQQAFESAGIEFLFDPPGIRLRPDEH